MPVASPLKHRRLVLWMRSQIESGAWKPHQQIPSEPELAVSLGVARGTLQKAVDELVSQRRLYRVRGKGTFVSEPVLEPSLTQRLLSLSEALDMEGVTDRTEVLSSGLADPIPVWVLEALKVDEGAQVLRLRRRKAVFEGPFAVLENYLDLARFPGIQRLNFNDRRLFDVVEHDYGFPIDWGSRLFDIEQAGKLLARELGTAPGTPLMRLEQVTYTLGNVPVECSRVWIRPDKVRLSALIRRDSG